MQAFWWAQSCFRAKLRDCQNISRTNREFVENGANLFHVRFHFLRELAQLGWKSLVLCLLPVAGSVALVYWLTRSMAREKRRQDAERRAAAGAEEDAP